MVFGVVMASVGDDKRFLILYGSQTGQAQAIAEDFHESSEKYGLTSSIFCLSDSEKKVEEGERKRERERERERESEREREREREREKSV